MELQKIWLMWRMYPEDVIDFERIQSKMVLQNYTKDQRLEILPTDLEGIYADQDDPFPDDASQSVERCGCSINEK